MTLKFSNIGLTARPNNPEVKSTFQTLVDFFNQQKINITIDKGCAQLTDKTSIKQVPLTKLGEHADLIIVIGGDGSLLKAARETLEYQKPIIGINRGRKGFLTDISPQALPQELTPILQGNFIEEKRFLLNAKLLRNGQKINEGIALNDVVVYSGDVARMIEIEVFINDTFVYKQRSDGLITSTPTGSTAYALSGGGPILHPSLNAITLVPMHPHTLSARPLVTDSQVKIEIHITPETRIQSRISLDGQHHFDVQPDDKVIITRYNKELRLLHPKEYDYYNTLRSKLGWNNFN